MKRLEQKWAVQEDTFLNCPALVVDTCRNVTEAVKIRTRKSATDVVKMATFQVPVEIMRTNQR